HPHASSSSDFSFLRPSSPHPPPLPSFPTRRSSDLIRPRKFTRHTFISAALSKEANLKWVARYCGTSVEMIDEHYGKWLGDDGGQLAILATRPTRPRRCNLW